MQDNKAIEVIYYDPKADLVCDPDSMISADSIVPRRRGVDPGIDPATIKILEQRVYAARSMLVGQETPKDFRENIEDFFDKEASGF